MIEVYGLLQEVRALTSALSFLQKFLSGIDHEVGIIDRALVQLPDRLQVGRVVHQVRVILVRHLINDQPFIKLADQVRGRGNCNPKNWSRETAAARESADLHGQQFTVQGARGSRAEEGNDRRRNHGYSFRR